MRPHKYVLLAATMTFGLISPALARLLAASIVGIGLALVWIDAVGIGGWRSGLVIDTLADDGTQLLAIAPVLGEPFAARVAAAVPQSGDVVVVFGDVANDLIEARHLGVLPIGLIRETAELAAIERAILETSHAGIVLLGIVIALAAPFVLRCTGAAILGAVALLSAFVLLHLNTAVRLVPIPPEFVDTIILLSGLAGAAAGFKASFADRFRWIARMAGFGIALAVIDRLAVGNDVYAPLLYTLPAIAIFLPALPVVLLATLILKDPLGLDLLEAAGTFAALWLAQGLLHAGLLRLLTGARRRPARHIDADDHGFVDLKTLVGEEAAR